MGIVEFITSLFDLIFLFFASLFDFSGQIEYRHPQIGEANTNRGRTINQLNNGRRANYVPMGGCPGGCCPH